MFNTIYPGTLALAIKSIRFGNRRRDRSSCKSVTARLSLAGRDLRFVGMYSP